MAIGLGFAANVSHDSFQILLGALTLVHAPLLLVGHVADSREHLVYECTEGVVHTALRLDLIGGCL